MVECAVQKFNCKSTNLQSMMKAKFTNVIKVTLKGRVETH